MIKGTIRAVNYLITYIIYLCIIWRLNKESNREFKKNHFHLFLYIVPKLEIHCDIGM